ncbi:uncharacterized protein LOC134725275 [Mytilus trossulus]|uniref:uncharacterized protein LOC134725275 n=1 Tax=Mytilus trossulus TaxID=6551 RepID=UPI003004B758
MTSVGAIEKTEKAIKNISKGKDKKEDCLLMMAPFANWDRFLTPAPSAIAILGELLLISTKTDFTLTEHMPAEGFQYIKYPDSFRACLVQVSNSGWNAFNEAHTSMDQIRLMSGNVDSHIKDSVRLLMAGSPKEVEKMLPLSLKNVEQIADDSLQLAENIEKKFLFVMHLTEELLEASTNTKSVYDRKANNTATLIQVAELEQTRAEEAKKERQKRYENMVKQVNKAQDEYTEAIKDMPGSGQLLGLSFAEGMVDSVKSIVGLPADMVRGLGKGSFNIAHDFLRCTNEQSHINIQTITKPYDVQLAEYNVLTTVPMIDVNIQNLALMIGIPGHIPDLNKIKENIGALQASLSRHQATVSAEKHSGKLGVRISELCKKATEICTEAQNIACAIYSDRTVADLQKKVFEIKTESMSLVAKANKRLGRNPLDEKSPCLGINPVQSENSNIVNSVMENGRFKTELAKETLRDTKDRQEAADKQLEEANERLCEALKTMKTLNLEEIDFDTVRKTLQQGIRALAQVRAQWGKLVIFFEEISNIIKCCMNTSLKKFVQTATVSLELKGEGELMSNAFRANMYEQTLHASRVSYVVSTMAGAYVEISRENLMDQITQLADLIGLDPGDDMQKIILGRQRLHDQCELAQHAIKKKIKEEHQKYENAVEERISRIQREVEAVMPPLENLTAIQEAVKEGFKEEDLDDLVG